MLCVPRKAHFLFLALSERRGGPTSWVVQGFSLPPFPASCLWMDYRWSEKDFLAQTESQSPVLCGEGFITGCQFMPTQIGPGCCRLTRETSCVWGRVCGGGNGSEKRMFTFMWDFSSSGVSNCQRPKVSGPWGDAAAWRLGTTIKC